ncbi:KilA-N domain-containing protein [Dyadobacter sp. CY107]|uniref:KilA-N domain-containing protein n=1 Tax=Dyadobacter fanqingshengii TaxID=2906443 RepID=UPI001F20ED53|nr:KilA-N domain-containing protein [Dyadobacter fanqingshengii]MCF2502580.1 KilA-N domain-containing protein [Dyadobacter fanqingshengii]
MVKIFEYLDSPIQFNVLEGRVMANATAMCQAFDKRPNDWLSLGSTKRYIEAVTRKNGNIDYEAVITKNGRGDMQGTWIDQRLILSLARWLSVEFEIWCDERIAELIRDSQVSVLSPAELLLAQAQQLVNHERKIRLIEDRQDKTENKIDELISTIKTRPDYFCVTAFCSLNKIHVNHKSAQRVGKTASRLCQERGFEIGSVPDTKWGSVGSYPSEILEQALQEEGIQLRQKAIYTK